jgi:DNA repair ATPase RecN|tara:strand:- start:12 stop:509 length:498 start_codon:yes stop_codon:yes gene_type:complete
MKMMHKFIFTITLLLLTSCSFSSKKERINRNLVDNKNISLLNIDEDQKIIIRKDYYGTYSFSSWNAYNVANTQIHQVKNLEYNSSVERIENLEKNISKLSSTIPDWLETNKVLKEIEDVKEEYATLLNEKDKSTKAIRENWEELSNEFDDLREELSETVKDYRAE